MNKLNKTVKEVTLEVRAFMNETRHHSDDCCWSYVV